MKKYWILLLAMSGLVAQAADAEAARIRFWGGLVITAQSAGCTNGSEINTKFGVRFRSAGVGDGTTSTISLFRMDSARNFEVDGRFNSAFKNARTTEIFDYASSPDSVVKVRFTSQSPATIAATTNFITATGQFSGWDNLSACVLTFRMTLSKLVES